MQARPSHLTLRTKTGMSVKFVPLSLGLYALHSLLCTRAHFYPWFVCGGNHRIMVCVCVYIYIKCGNFLKTSHIQYIHFSILNACENTLLYWWMQLCFLRGNEREGIYKFTKHICHLWSKTDITNHIHTEIFQDNNLRDDSSSTGNTSRTVNPLCTPLVLQFTLCFLPSRSSSGFVLSCPDGHWINGRPLDAGLPWTSALIRGTPFFVPGS